VDDAAQPSFEAQDSYEFYNDASVPQGSSQLLSQMSTTMLTQMTNEGSIPSRLVQNLGPLPDAEFVVSNSPTERPGVPMTTATKAGKQATTKKKKTTKQGAHGGDKQNQAKKKKSTKKAAVK